MIEITATNNIGIEYGTTVRDKVTHFVGKVTAVVDYFDKRPVQVLAESIDQTGRPMEIWIDLDRVELADGRY